MENQILIALKNNKLLKNILFTELDLSAIKGNLLTLSEGEILFREGDRSEFLYLIVSGEMNVLRKKGARRTLSEIFTDHDFFGSDEFIQSTQRNSTAVALRDSYIIALSKGEIDSLIEQDDEILTNLYESLHQEEDDEEIPAPSGTIDFKKAGKQDVSFADKLKREKEARKTKAELEGEDIESSDFSSASEEPNKKSKSPEEKDDTTEPFENSFGQFSKSFSKITHSEEDKPKSFKDKIASGRDTDESPEIESSEEIPTNEQFEDVSPDTSSDSPEEMKEPDTQDSPEHDTPSSFEISFTTDSDIKEDDASLSSYDELPNNDLPDENPEQPVTGEDEVLSDQSESELPKVTDEDDSEINPPADDIKSTYSELENFNTEYEEPASNEVTDNSVAQEEESVTKEESTQDSNKDLEDFYASISDTIINEETEADNKNIEEDPLAGLEDYNPFPEEEQSKPEESNPHEYTIGEEYKPEEDTSLPDFSTTPDETKQEDEFPSESFQTEDYEQVPPNEFSLPELENESPDAEEEEYVPGLETQSFETTDDPVSSGGSDETPITDSPEEKTRDYDEVEQSIDMLEKINKAAQIVNSNIQIDDVFKSIVDVARDLTNADRGTLYLVDRKKNELWSKVAIGNEFKEIKLGMGEGIAGWVAQKGEIINLEEVSSDPRFNSSFDKASGYETKTMLCFPIRNKNEDIVGVLQLINSRKGKFTKLDEEFLGALSIHAAMALQNADLVEQLLTGERVSSLGKMANFLLQDIKKPIMVSKRYAEHLKSKVLEEDVGRVVDMLLDQLNHIADLVQSTSSYSEGQIVLRSMLCKLNETLDDYISRVDSILRASNCQIVKEYDKEINVKISPKQMFQCFQHIIKNACDAMPDGGTIHLSTKIEKETVHIIVKDSGLGIPESLHDKIFEPFMSHGKKEGTGLGLSITKKIIEEHGGKISVRSEMGEGATFTISLPIVFGM